MTRPLTIREAEVLRWTTQSWSTGRIATALGIAASTVRAALARVLRALGVRTVDEAIQRHHGAAADQVPTPEQEPAATTRPADGPRPRLFHLQRDHDVTGVSGTGVVAWGVQWPDGTVTIRWTGDRPSTVNWASIDDAVHVHGHGGHTRIVWADGTE
ncbi:helix-turn-helix transcriptional regulator [Kitasatospora sp. NPDC048239]|uniref:helix-turn-helix domain-containing protein n=1 Tax=Kitasatospora sp. NPDC048239 TaxID=3364046 RepID=UPI0037151F24